MSTIPHAPDHLREAVLAILICLTGWLSFSICDTMSKWLTQSYTVSQIICLSSFPVALSSAAIIFFRHGKAGFKTPDLKWHLMRAVLVVLTALFVVSALKTVPLADFYGITFLAPFLAALLAYFFLGENMGAHRFIAIICGFVGVLVIAQPQFASYSIGILLSFAVALTVSSTAIVLRKMKDKTNVFLFAFFPSLFNSIIHAPVTVQNFVMPSGFDAALFLCLSGFVMGGLVILSVGLRKAPLYAIVAPFQYTQIIWGIALGYLVFGDVPAQTTLAGIVIIVLSGFYLIWREYKTHGPAKSKAERKMRLFSRSRG